MECDSRTCVFYLYKGLSEVFLGRTVMDRVNHAPQYIGVYDFILAKKQQNVETAY